LVVGLLKVGCKKLFVYDTQGVQHEMQPLCVLDFYVHESCQRRGYGKKLFECMMQVSLFFSSSLFTLFPKFLTFFSYRHDEKTFTDCIGGTGNAFACVHPFVSTLTFEPIDI